jgi:hypothetical protein
MQTQFEFSKRQNCVSKFNCQICLNFRELSDIIVDITNFAILKTLSLNHRHENNLK